MNRSRFEWLLIAVLSAIIVFLMFVPPTLGIANNGDYLKMVGRFSMGPDDPREPDAAIYYEQRWRFHPTYSWISDNYSSELLLIGLAVNVAQAFDHRYFDIRFLGTIHALCWIGCFAAALPLFRRLPGWSRYVLPVLLLFVFSDASYVAQFNSFQTDTAACLFLAWCVTIALRMAVRDWRGWPAMAAFLLSAVLFATAKPQHSLLALLLWLLAIYMATWFGGAVRIGVWLALTSMVLFASWIELQNVPEGERRHELSNAIFVKVLGLSHSPEQDLVLMGLPPEFARYKGVSAERSYDNPLDNPRLLDSLTVEAHRRVAMFDLTHPGRTVRIIYRDLKGAAVRRIPPFLGYYQRDSGLPPLSRPRTFVWWSDLRSFLVRIAPWHILVWYALFAGAAIVGMLKPTNASVRRVSAVALVLALQGLAALAFSSLGESGETDRHLWIFHVVTDMTIVLGAAGFALRRLIKPSTAAAPAPV
jgi:hypothetical protein